MTDLTAYCPGPPEWRLRWEEMDREYEWIRRLAGCPQDPLYHAEGDVWVHTRMVCAELIALAPWRALPQPERETLFLAAVLHDVGKPDCTRSDEEGRIRSRGHSRRGAILARQVLWRMGVPFAVREQVGALVRHHQTPYYLIERADAARLAVAVSQTARGDLLALLAEADVRGRLCADRQRLLDNVALFAEQLRDVGCLHDPYPFASDHARVLFFRDPRRHPDDPAHVAFRAEVVLLSGLPGAGKDHYRHAHLPDWPVVSLDDLRGELGVDPADDQGEVIAAARARARDHLRRGERFVWNATNVSRQLRGVALDLFHQYQARVRVVYVEAPPAVLAAQNRRRPAAVPDAVMARLLDRWEVPDLTEAHAIDYRVRDAGRAG